ncbi:energy-coupling factor transporter ATPase [Paenibacillus sp. MER 180]|uniref:energy-coupling factor transporter ATPase n=1 Tax=unclassified Paenibacillus TaxID=185978 RepID=UPI0008065E19|nr:MULTISPECIES: energy-coupling factor transporter ATPase [unclassified Paenibacillus]MCM3294059.1 energy-coupling factor transporter ATPase [Paenibacillus sp. MER 180]OBY76502.1 energy-coupling factor transporter ATPase [Paenibacillus sp. KS1]
MSLPEFAVQVEQLSYTYMKGTPFQHDALYDVYFHARSGECVAIIGHTGSGKSTLIQHLNGLLLPQTGQVNVLGYELSKSKHLQSEIRRQVVVLFQQPEDQLFEKYVADDIAYGPLQYGLSKKEVIQRVKHAMDFVGLPFETMRNRPIYALSGGQKRKVALAGLLALDPRVLVLDEPTAGLDPMSRQELLYKIKRLSRDEGRTIIFVTHSMEEVALLADRVYVLADGSNVADGTTREIFAKRELIHRYRIGTPQSVELVHTLIANGYDMNSSTFGVEETVAEVSKLLHQEVG